MVHRYKYKISKGLDEANTLASKGWRCASFHVTKERVPYFVMEYDLAG